MPTFMFLFLVFIGGLVVGFVSMKKGDTICILATMTYTLSAIALAVFLTLMGFL